VLVEGRSPDRARGAWIRDLVRTVARFYPLGLGSPRRRRYGYLPPPGWQAVPRSGCVVWLDPEFPRASGRITVHDARPMKWHAPGAVDRFLFVDENPFATRDAPRPPVVLTEPIPGQAVRASGRTSDGTAIGQLKVQLADETYLYIAQLDSKLVEWDPLLPVFEDVVRSIEPVPAGSLEPSATQFVHWIE
jgi:hypothetical protein